MGKTFRQRARDARVHVKMLSPIEAKRIADGGGAMVIDVREAWEVAEHGTIPGARNITRGELDIKADSELPRRDPALQDRAQTIILTCGGGGKATLSAAILAEMGFTDLWVIEGGCRAWQAAGYALAPPGK